MKQRHFTIAECQSKAACLNLENLFCLSDIQNLFGIGKIYFDEVTSRINLEFGKTNLMKCYPK